MSFNLCPFLMSVTSFNLLFMVGLTSKPGLISILESLVHSNIKEFYFFMNTLSILLVMILWLMNISMENNFFGSHNIQSEFSFKLGMVLFITSEVFFFFGFFWTYFHSSLNSEFNTGLMWPVYGMDFINPFSIPLLNSIFLVSSGVTVTLTHYELMSSNTNMSQFWLFFTILLGLLFLMLQVFEYSISLFSFSDSVFGSIFFMGTGFHGFHVFIGMMMLIIMFLKNFFNFSLESMFSYEMVIWYWHFVDVVWLFLYFWFYWWPSI